MPFIVNVQLKESSTLNIFSYETKTFYVRPAREAFYFASFIIAVGNIYLRAKENM